jgi:hypothetical protein
MPAPEQAAEFRRLLAKAMVTGDRGLVLQSALLKVVVSVWPAEEAEDDLDEPEATPAPSSGRLPPPAVQSPALEAVQQQGRVAATPAVVAALADLADHLTALGCAAAATPEVVAALAGLLAGEDRASRAAASRAVRDLGQVAAAPEILARLGRLLRALEREVREAAAAALGGMGRAATPEVLASLAALLFDADWRVGAAAAEVVSRLGCGKAVEEHLRQAPPRLDEPRPVGRPSAGGQDGGEGRFDLLVSAFAPGNKRVSLNKMGLYSRGQDDSGAVVRIAEATGRGDLAIDGMRAGLDWTLRAPEVMGRSGTPVVLPWGGGAWAAQGMRPAVPAPEELPVYESMDGAVCGLVRPLGDDKAVVTFETREARLAGATVRFSLVEESGRVGHSGEKQVEEAAEGVWEGRWTGTVRLKGPCELVFEVVPTPRSTEDEA